MKYTLALLSAAVAVTAAQPHRHAHPHQHQDAKRGDPVVVVPGPTVIAYVLNGHPISEADVQEGIKNGTLVWAQGGGLSSVASSAPATSSYAVPSSTSSAWSSTSSTAWSSSSSSSSYAPSSTWAASSSSTWSAPAYTSSSASSGSGSSSSGSGDFSSDSSTGIDSDFPDGQLSCSTFPSRYGAVPVDWLGLGGWIGVQTPGSGSSLLTGLTNLITAISGESCTEGSYCSYACPPGYQKSQWPETQGSSGQSVGGLLCQNGKLHLTNPGMSKKLCMKGTEEVTVLVKNTMRKDVAVCRTDYPGTESETVPIDCKAGTTTNLTCPDADNYYNWEGSHTSAQYYVNPAGVSLPDACQWGSSSNPWGNFAPLNLGVGYSNGAAWLSIFQNLPTTSATLDFTVELQGDNMSGKCRYQNGQYCSGDNYGTCSSTTGCTVSISIKILVTSIMMTFTLGIGELRHGLLRVLIVVATSARREGNDAQGGGVSHIT
jgi:SUN family beta-glucosidase